VLYRRARTVIAYWEGADLVVVNFARRTTVRLGPGESGLLQSLDSWRDARQIKRLCPGLTGPRVEQTLETLSAAGVVERSDRPASAVQAGLDAWKGWQPSAAFFHFDTKDGQFADSETVEALFEERMAFERVPSSLKRSRGARTMLPDFRRRGAFPRVLLARRSWRRFGSDAIALNDLSTLLGLTWGTQKWMHFRYATLALKTSPSGGACHSLEVYVAVRAVDGLAPGIYHYCPDTHSLTRRRRRWSAKWLSRSLAGQDWFANAGAVVFMTSVFPRVQWKYRASRAYRTVLLEAGHFCQTFCLTATWLGLAPFCTASLSDSYIERSLGIDGVTESVIYVTGVGSRPAAAWAPRPDGGRPPLTTEPTSFTRFKGSRTP